MATASLAEFFGWLTAVVPFVAAIWAFVLGRRQSLAIAVVALIIALLAQYYRTQAMADLTVNRWEPLSNSEKLSLKVEFEHMPAPKATLQVLCPLAGCADLAESLLAVFPLPNWKVAAGAAYWDGIPTGIELWGQEKAQVEQIAAAIRRATSGRIQVLPKTTPGESDQINILIGRKPK